MKIAFLLLVSCGRSECQDYATVYCQKAGTCGYAIDGVIVMPARQSCEKEALEIFAANRITEAQCSDARQRVAAMTCDQFRKFAAGQ